MHILAERLSPHRNASRFKCTPHTIYKQRSILSQHSVIIVQWRGLVCVFVLQTRFYTQK